MISSYVLGFIVLYLDCSTISELTVSLSHCNGIIAEFCHIMTVKSVSSKCVGLIRLIIYDGIAREVLGVWDFYAIIIHPILYPFIKRRPVRFSGRIVCDIYYQLLWSIVSIKKKRNILWRFRRKCFLFFIIFFNDSK